MTIDDLRAALADLPGDLPVILPADAEGNSYSPASGVEIALYSAANQWEGERYEQGETPPGEACPAVFVIPTR